MTGQRRSVLQALQQYPGHPTAEELYRAALKDDPSIHLSTVYRTLRWLQGEGLVNSRVFDEDRRQERFDAVLPSTHHHFLCNRCKAVIEFADPHLAELSTSFADQHGVLVESASLVLYGLCPDCQITQKG
jgi:Fe2+ or Zn2+ uptake regulation protein